MSCHDISYDKSALELDKILLMGNPNVGKSVIFSRLTGIHVESANYTGTTVSYTKGKISLDNGEIDLIDVPGTYSLESTSEAEDVAIEFMNSHPKGVICVLDASHLERNLKLALQIKEYNVPVVYVLNLIDVAERQGIHIDVEKLEKELGATVIPTVAVKEQGLKEVKDHLSKLIKQNDSSYTKEKVKMTNDELWETATNIAKKVQKKIDAKPNFLEKLGEKMIEPFPGIPIAIIVMFLSLGIIVGGGKALRAGILLPIINNGLVPFLTGIVSKFTEPGIVRNLLVGEFGILIKGIEWPFALILPYVLLFYIVFSFLEDSGYLPRIGVLLDGLMRKIGIQGGSMIPILMGYGCAVPAIIGTRASTSKKERIMVASIVCFAVPCVSQTGAFISLLANHSMILLIGIYLISIITMMVVSFIVGKLVKGEVKPLVIEIPSLLMPEKKSYLRKLKVRIKHFMVEAEVPMLIGVVIAAIVVETGLLNQFSSFIEPLVVSWLGLPKEASLALILGIIRRELAVLPLLEMNLNGLQMFVGSIVALFYLPCLSVFAILVKEFNLKTALLLGTATTLSALVMGGIVNQIGMLIF